ncbi:hypothetical protein BV898_16065 [Hypsibius exemplaris]|uniref:Aquaporin n=1 Tax=Hypsibius exemplaris TaxID=2072580 RepID=A0A9X6RL50_HYPEX|nr:hypothetical protein BV898_16065 [Hypsibius exemplaris]
MTNGEVDEAGYDSTTEHLFIAGFKTPLGSFFAQTLLTQMIILSIQRLSDGQGRFFEEFICTFQTAVLSQELEIIRQAHGLLAYAVAMFALSILYTLTFRKGVHANPVSTIHLFSTHDRFSEVAELVVHLSVQTFAAVVAEKYVHMLWSARIFNSGLAVIHMGTPCKSDLKVPATVGILIECAATFVFRLLNHAPRGGLAEVVLCSLAGVLCNLAAIPFTGGYFNPSIALTTQFACHGHEHWEFAMVYLAGPVIAAYLVGQYGDRIWRLLQPYRHRPLRHPASIHRIDSSHVQHPDGGHRHVDGHHHFLRPRSSLLFWKLETGVADFFRAQIWGFGCGKRRKPEAVNGFGVSSVEAD